MVDWPSLNAKTVVFVVLALLVTWFVIHLLQLLATVVLGLLSVVGVTVVVWFLVRVWWRRRE
ncbi:hypothetical protein [Halospeciosus flavus]|uniref:Uncharacterized protein n=1 Tax=Halospeciosus flavus TaxID=3032283 RepID=A0ABD5Z798_9EURY|nr:hypothetical protein [Halospeciosus flavus]